jgi:conjugal transfer/type IV secretion protein DotA/TraY
MAFPDLLATPSPDNLVWRAVDTILSENPSALAVGFQLFASGLLAFIGLKLAFFVITGITKATRAEKQFSEYYNHIWGPLAIIFGVGILIPLPSTGMPAGVYALKHLIAKPSVNLFDAIMVGTAEYLIKDGRPIAPLAIYGKEFAWSVVQLEVCSHVLKQAATRHENLGVVDSAVPPKPPASVGKLVENKKDGTFRVHWDWGTQCGSISLSDPQDFGAFGAERRIAAYKLINEVRALNVHEGLVESLREHGENPAYVDHYAQETFIDDHIKSGTLVNGLTEKVNAIGAAYEKAVGDAAAKQVQTGQTEQRAKLVEGVRTYGGAVFLGYFRLISVLNEKANDLASEKPEYTPPKWEAIGTSPTVKGEVKFALAVLDSQRTLENKELKLSGDDMAFAGEDESSVLTDIVNSITKPFLQYVTSYDGWRVDPVSDLINVGGNMMTSAKVGFGIGMAATGGSNFWSSTAGKIVEYAMTPVWPLLTVMYVGGAMLSIVLPNLPLIYGIFGITAFVLELIVAAISVMVWAFMHARLDHGDSFVSPVSAPGYKILFGLFLRLPINALALIAGITANTVVLNIFLFIWSFAFQGSQIGKIIGIASIIAAFAIMLYIPWKIVNMMFSLNSNLNERVAQWFGHAVQSFGEAMQGNTVVAGIHANAGAGANQKPQAGNRAPNGKNGGPDNAPAGGSRPRFRSAPPGNKTSTK